MNRSTFRKALMLILVTFAGALVGGVVVGDPMYAAIFAAMAVGEYAMLILIKVYS